MDNNQHSPYEHSEPPSSETPSPQDDYSDPHQSEDDYFNIEDLKAYMSLSVEEKLIYLQEINSLLAKVMPDDNKKIWEKLKQKGW